MHESIGFGEGVNNEFVDSLDFLVMIFEVVGCIILITIDILQLCAVQIRDLVFAQEGVNQHVLATTRGPEDKEYVPAPILDECLEDLLLPEQIDCGLYNTTITVYLLYCVTS